ncbi:MAG TPA: cbb3-type cytochrome c oxidase subunit I [Candidatus Binataceae bacterium]|nr:cbb3-type cytochrome c oxidase subunit I [Candidatus Binataceae bacterium]
MEAQLSHIEHVDHHHHPQSLISKYVFSTDHKMIAKQYLAVGLLMALVGGAMAYLIRVQLAWPGKPVTGWGFIAPGSYMAMVTMHGTIMVFFVAMPILLGAFGNYLIPLMIGAPDMAFPRLNMMSVWTLFVASLVLIASMLVPGSAPNAGWTGYPPLSAVPEYSGSTWGINLWLLALALEFSSFLMGGINFVTTAINMRAPGLTFWRLPLVVWMEITASALFLLSVGPLVAGSVMLLLDRVLGTTFYAPSQGGDPLLWQHLFWFFGHPEVYVIALPAIGMMMEILPVFARKPMFGYRAIIYSTIIAGFLSLIVWAHHMFVSGMDPRLATPFSILTILISIPFAVMIFAMIATLWRGSIIFSTPMLFTLAALSSFLIGGVTGIFLGSQAADIYLHDSYFVVAHFHYTLFPLLFMGGFAGIYYWFPKMFGKMYSEPLGKLHCVLTFVFFNLTFIPLFMAGFGGAPRRIYFPYGYDFLKPLQHYHVIATYGAIGLLLGQLPFVINLFASMISGRKAETNPWHANTLEWTAPSPPPHGNFEHVPHVVRGPYDYSVPGVAEDWVAQDKVVTVTVAAAG